MHDRSYYIINGITFYRMLAAPFLILLVIFHGLDIFKWLLLFSFFTDAIDGYLARRYKVTSVLGSRIDSIADDLTICAAIAGMIVLKPDFLRSEMPILILLGALFIVQTSLAFIRYGRMTSFHVYTAKVAAVLQAIFLLLLFFLPEPISILFYVTGIITAIDLVEETILVIMLPEWEANVKGLYWIIKRKWSMHS